MTSVKSTSNSVIHFLISAVRLNYICGTFLWSSCFSTRFSIFEFIFYCLESVVQVSSSSIPIFVSFSFGLLVFGCRLYVCECFLCYFLLFFHLDVSSTEHLFLDKAIMIFIVPSQQTHLLYRLITLQIREPANGPGGPSQAQNPIWSMLV